MKTLVQRLNNISGQIEGVRRLIDKDSDCLTVLTQLKAVRSAVTSVMDLVIEERLQSCMKNMTNEDKKLFSKIKNYVQYN